MSPSNSKIPSHPEDSIMADSISYPATNHYISPHTQYYSPQIPPNHGHVHVVSAPPRPEPQRKRPKYTRSKTGCLTCRVKKIKCDETKPNCMRCTHGQRDCTWPEGAPPRKKTNTPRKDSTDGRPSTAGSSGPSEASTPPARDLSPPRRAPIELGLPPLASRRHTEPYLQLHPLGQDTDPTRRHHVANLERSSSGYPPLNSGPSGSISLIPQISSYPNQHPSSHHRYDQYSGNSHPANSHVNSSRNIPNHSMPSNMRTMGHQSSGQWNPPPLMSSVDSITPYFHSVQERNLIRHYCDNSLSLIMAAPSENNPIVAANLPLIFSRPPGDVSANALRMALLGVSAVHQSFLLARTGVTQPGAAQMLQLANSYRMNSRMLLAKACTTIEGTQSDASLAACIAISLMDIFSGGRNWLKTMELAKSLVEVRGGPAALLAYGSIPGPDEGISRTRILLEILSVYDIFGCLANGKEPTLLSSKGNSWWLEETHPGFSYVEQVFGMSRSFIPLLATVTTFVSRVLNRGSTRITEIDSDDNDKSDGEETKKCHELYNELENWSNSSPHISVRVQTGDNIYRRAAQIMLLRDVLHVPHTDPLVQQCSDIILTLCYECCNGQMGVDLIWPVIIAGSHVSGGNRKRVVEIFEAFRAQCCYEIDTSEQIVNQVWSRLDQGQLGAEWRSVMRDFDLNVLIL